MLSGTSYQYDAHGRIRAAADALVAEGVPYEAELATVVAVPSHAEGYGLPVRR